MSTKPTTIEDEYVWREEQKLRLRTLAEQQKAVPDSEKQRLKELHWMHCPKCGQELATERCGPVEIDVCPGCKGLWLDANELQTLVADARHGGFLRSCLKLFRGK